MNAPIALFVYARLDHTQRTVEALSKNLGANASDLIIFSDAAKSRESSSAVDEVRKYLEGITGFRTVTIFERERNFGLAESIIQGVTQVLSDYENLIVLEDDMITSPYFLNYMNEGLNKFIANEEIISIHGYVYPVKKVLPEAFLLRGADCWGWATWRRGWALFNPDGEYLLDQIRKRNLLKLFDFNNTYSYSGMLKGQIEGKNDSWAIRWYASAFLADKLTLYPGRSLVHNIGNDSSGTHCGTSDSLNTELSLTAIDLSTLSFSPSTEARLAFEEFFESSRESLTRKVLRRLRESYYKAKK